MGNGGKVNTTISLLQRCLRELARLVGRGKWWSIAETSRGSAQCQALFSYIGIFIEIPHPALHAVLSHKRAR
jgi:hypothetical protein